MLTTITEEKIIQFLQENYGDELILKPGSIDTEKEVLTVIDKTYGTWTTKISNILTHKRRHFKRNIRQKLSYDDVIKKLLNRFNGLVTLVDLQFNGPEHNHTFFDLEYGNFVTTYRKLMTTTGHPKRGVKLSAESKRYTIDEVVEKLRINRGDIIKLEVSTYKSMLEKATFIYDNAIKWDAIVWDVINIKNKFPPDISLKLRSKFRLTENEINRRLKESHNDKVTIDYSTYIGFTKSCTFIDVDYGRFENIASNVIHHRQRHPARTRSFSKKENLVLEFVRSLGYVANKKRFGTSKKWGKCRSFELDIFIPELKKGIEFNGKYWHGDGFNRDWTSDPDEYHRVKREFFKSLSIDYLDLWEIDWNNNQEESKNKIISFLKSN